MRAVGVIPARYAASRFPGKLLAPIAGRPMLAYVIEGARRARSLADVIVATDDERIARACAALGTRALLTARDHASGTDRIAEVAQGLAADVIVNVQGDEPLIEGFVIDAVVGALAAAPAAALATAVHAAPPEAAADPNRVKVVLDRDGNALYFSRSAIPFGSAGPLWQHVGLYAYRRDFLLQFPRLARTPAEQSERLEQLRALEHGYAIRCAVIEGWHSIPVDVPADVARVEAALAARRGAEEGDAG